MKLNFTPLDYEPEIKSLIRSDGPKLPRAGHKNYGGFFFWRKPADSVNVMRTRKKSYGEI